MKTGKLRLAIVGLGRIAWMLEEDPLRPKPCTHWGAWRERDDIIPVGACDINPDRRNAFSQRFPDIPVFAEFGTMLEHSKPNILSICAYATTRCTMIRQALTSGVKGIWCEKALATSIEEASEIVDALTRAQGHLSLAHMRRWDPNYDTAASLIRDGAIGKPESANIHFSGNMIHTGTHAFDLLHAWFGPALTVQAWLDHTPSQQTSLQSGYRFDEDTDPQDPGGFAVITFDAGIRATVHAGNKAYFRFETEILGTHGMIRIGNTQRQLWQTGVSPHFTGFRELKSLPFPKLPYTNPWRAAADDLIQAVRTGLPTRCGAEDGKQALAIGIAMHHSHACGNTPVLLSALDPGLLVPNR